VATFNRNLDAVLACKPHRSHDVTCTAAPHHETRASIDHGVPDRSGLVVSRISGKQKFSTQASLELVQRLLIELDLAAFGGLELQHVRLLTQGDAE
jgi:hypothetical protein